MKTTLAAPTDPRLTGTVTLLTFEGLACDVRIPSLKSSLGLMSSRVWRLVTAIHFKSSAGFRSI
jgi:hypothetical protein